MIIEALRQALGAAVRWGYMAWNPAKLWAEPSAGAAAGTRVHLVEVDAIAIELSLVYQPLPEVRRRDRATHRGVAGTGTTRHRPPRPDLSVRRTVSGGEVSKPARRPLSPAVPLGQRAGRPRRYRQARYAAVLGARTAGR